MSTEKRPTVAEVRRDTLSSIQTTLSMVRELPLNADQTNANANLIDSLNNTLMTLREEGHKEDNKLLKDCLILIDSDDRSDVGPQEEGFRRNVVTLLKARLAE